MVRQGLARVCSFQDNRALVGDILAIEQSARSAKRGIWALAFYGVRQAEQTGDFLDRFELIEGRILAAEQVGGRIYLKFGEVWRTDFPISVAPSDTELFENAGIDLLSLSGQRIRMRGWLRNFNGSVIDLTHPEQLESLGL